MSGWDDETWRYGSDSGFGSDSDPSDERHRAVTHGVRSTAGIPDDALRMGLDRNTVEGAMVGMSGSLDSSKVSHRVLAWVLLAALVGPLLWNFLVQLARVL